MKGLIFLLLLLTFTLANSNKCRILSFSSGTEKVAYQVGALKALVENLQPEDVQYNVIAGVSFGGLNAAVASVHGIGDEQEMVDELYSLWKNAKDIKAYQNWWFGPAQGAFYKGGLYDNTPWEKTLAKILDGRGAKKEILLGAVDVHTGLYQDLMDLATEEKLEKALFASTALNVWFPPVEEFGKKWYDGSGVWSIEVLGPIRKCEEMGFKREDIIVDVLMTNSDHLPARNSTGDGAIPSALRYLEISEFYSGIDGIARAAAGFKEVNFRYCVNPGSEHLPTSWFPFAFKQKQVDQLLDRGYNDAMRLINDPSIVSCEDMVKTAKARKAPKVPKEVIELMQGKAE
jgi:predicted acylesterase/phospholipase RssA